MRAIGALVAITILVAATVFFADNPGRVEISWQGWQIDTSVGVLVATAILAALLLRLLSRVLGGPRTFLRRRRERHRRAGYRALTRGMVAVAAGDSQDARRHARRAELLLAEPPLTLLLSAQAAQIGGDDIAAKRFFTLMLDRRETEFLGLRGLFNQALREGDRGAALRLAERAVALRPRTGWAVQSLFDLETRDGQWQSARVTLAKAVKAGIIASEAARHHRGVIDYELSLLAAGRGDLKPALTLAAQAQTMVPDLATPALHHMRLLLQEGRTGRAAKAVERAWRTAANPELAQAYRAIWRAENPLSLVVRFERLAAQNPVARESQIALGEAALAAQLWGEARRHLEQALRADPVPPARIPANSSPAASASPNESQGGEFARATPRLCRIMAQLEEAEHGDFARVREWLDRAAWALPDPRYVCVACGGDNLEWSSLCPRCGAFDALAWRTPVWSGPDHALPFAADRRVGADVTLSAPGDPPSVKPANGRRPRWRKRLGGVA